VLPSSTLFTVDPLILKSAEGNRIQVIFYALWWFDKFNSFYFVNFPKSDQQQFIAIYPFWFSSLFVMSVKECHHFTPIKIVLESEKRKLNSEAFFMSCDTWICFCIDLLLLIFPNTSFFYLSVHWKMSLLNAYWDCSWKWKRKQNSEAFLCLAILKYAFA
jgi:hypothetical protein